MVMHLLHFMVQLGTNLLSRQGLTPEFKVLIWTKPFTGLNALSFNPCKIGTYTSPRPRIVPT